MAGMFELFMDADAHYRFRLTAPDGTIMAVSKPFDTKSAAVSGIAAVREYAGMGLITDQCTTNTHETPPRYPEVSATHAGDYPRAPKSDFHARSRALRRLPASSRWARAL
ncbi:YegP family protein [Arthrobacter sp. C152]